MRRIAFYTCLYYSCFMRINEETGNDAADDAAGFRAKPHHLLMLIVTFFWAVGHPLGSIILKHIHPFQLACVNLVLGCAGLFVFLWGSGKLRGLREFTLKEILHSMTLGVFGFFSYQICTFSALNRIPASMNAVLITTNVIFITVLAMVFFREKLSLLKGLGIVSAAAGAVFVVFNEGFSLSGNFKYGGAIFSFGAALSFTAYSLGGKKLLSRKDPALVTGLALFAGLVLLTVFTALSVGFKPLFYVPGRIWLLMLVLSLGMIGLAYPLWFYCLKKADASEIAVFIYLVPVFAGILSFIILGERFAWRFYLGGALILAGIVLANTGRLRNVSAT